MSRKLFGVTLIALSLGLAAAAVFALIDASRMAHLLGALSGARPQGEQFDHPDWLWHWRSGSARLLGYGLAGSVAGFAVLFRRSWGFLLWAIVASCLLLDSVVALLAGGAVYAFQAVGVGELLVFAGIATVSWLAYFGVVHAANRRT